MLTVAVPPEQRVVLRGVTWETYERLLADRGEAASPRIMSPGAAHEWIASFVGPLVCALAEAGDLDVVPLGHLTSRTPRSNVSLPEGGVGAADALTRLLQEGRRTPLPRWLAAVRRWATA